MSKRHSFYPPKCLWGQNGIPLFSTDQDNSLENKCLVVIGVRGLHMPSKLLHDIILVKALCATIKSCDYAS